MPRHQLIAGFNHVGISVKSLANSIAFYCKHLDMRVVEVPVKFEGPIYEQILGLKGVRGKAAVLQKATLQLELFEFAVPKPKRKNVKYPVSDHGLSHFCVEVTNIHSVYQRMRKAGVTFHCPPLNFFGEALATYARDLDGNVFELLELNKTEGSL